MTVIEKRGCIVRNARVIDRYDAAFPGLAFQWETPGPCYYLKIDDHARSMSRVKRRPSSRPFFPLLFLLSFFPTLPPLFFPTRFVGSRANVEITRR